MIIVNDNVYNIAYEQNCVKRVEFITTWIV